MVLNVCLRGTEYESSTGPATSRATAKRTLEAKEAITLARARKIRLGRFPTGLDLNF